MKTILGHRMRFISGDQEMRLYTATHKMLNCQQASTGGIAGTFTYRLTATALRAVLYV